MVWDDIADIKKTVSLTEAKGCQSLPEPIKTMGN
jgi:hypothetical protein